MGGHISMVLEVESSDLFDRGFNFLEGSIITNPPYSLADEFVKKDFEGVKEVHII